jgi:hypothetical protein
VVEGARLESVYTGNRIEGSNPSPSAIASSQDAEIIMSLYLLQSASPPYSPPS